MNKAILLSLMSVLIFSCSNPEKIVWVDNPGEEPLTVTFGGDQTVELEPSQTLEVQIKFGETTVQAGDGDPEKMTLDIDRDYLINPLKATYYIEKLKFFPSEEDRIKYEKYYAKTTDIEGMEVNGEFKKIEGQLAIPKTWDYGIGENTDEQIVRKIDRQVEEYTLEKIHRKDELVSTLKDEMYLYLQTKLQKAAEEKEGKE